jgi:EAL domain-containing protein (putative c-di-GMP-specific phosphodiesterase class I)
VHTYTDPRVALDDFANAEPDLVLLDLHMPHIDGIEFLRRMHARQRGHGFVPVLVLTADSAADALKNVLRAGANDFLSKPIDLDELLLRVQNLLSIRLCYQELVCHNAALARELRTRVHVDDRRAADRTRVIRATRDVIERGGPSMVFQPFVDLTTGLPLGVEALARFGTEPRRGPDQWFNDAAAVGLGAELELSALEAALSQRVQLHPSWVLAVNVSPSTLFTPQFSELVRDIDVRGISFEITEHQPIDDYQALRLITDDLHQRGAHITVDDAGAGYASLRHILKLHPDVIKLDISLTRGIDGDPVKYALASSLLRFAEQVSAEIIAEGIETERELDVLRELGIHAGQGFYLGGPARPVELLDLWPSQALASPSASRV